MPKNFITSCQRSRQKPFVASRLSQQVLIEENNCSSEILRRQLSVLWIFNTFPARGFGHVTSMLFPTPIAPSTRPQISLSTVTIKLAIWSSQQSERFQSLTLAMMTSLQKSIAHHAFGSVFVWENVFELPSIARSAGYGGVGYSELCVTVLKSLTMLTLGPGTYLGFSERQNKLTSAIVKGKFT